MVQDWVEFNALKEQLSNSNGILVSPVKINGKQYLQSIIKDNDIYKEKVHGIVNFVPLLDGVIT